MIIRHDVKILDQKAQYVARIKNDKVHVTVPRIVFKGSVAHLVTRQITLDFRGVVTNVNLFVNAGLILAAWAYIGRHINDAYLQGVAKND